MQLPARCEPARRLRGHGQGRRSYEGSSSVLYHQSRDLVAGQFKPSQMRSDTPRVKRDAPACLRLLSLSLAQEIALLLTHEGLSAPDDNVDGSAKIARPDGGKIRHETEIFTFKLFVIHRFFGLAAAKPANIAHFLPD